MKKGINIDSPTFATHFLKMHPEGSNNILASGTGFVYQYEDIIYLITNGHNITRVNPEQTERIHNSIAYPTTITTKARIYSDEKPDHIGISESFVIDLYNDQKMNIITIETEAFKKLMQSIDELKQLVSNGFNGKEAAYMNRVWLNKKEVCQMLRISERSLQTYRNNGEIPYTKIGSKIFYNAEEIKEVINNNTRFAHAKTK